MNLLTLNQVKMLKNHKQGYLSAILNLQPAYKYAGRNTCPDAGKCKATCLAFTGRNRFDMSAEARLRKTHLYYDAPEEFYAMLVADIYALRRKAEREQLIPTVRLNGLSDIAWELDNVLGSGKTIFELFPNLQFIDYTKTVERMFRYQPENYHLTYSINEKTREGTYTMIEKTTRFNACAVFYGELPKRHYIDNRMVQVISGDEHDLRHLDKRTRLIGLQYKKAFVDEGKAYRPERSNGFLNVVA